MSDDREDRKIDRKRFLLWLLNVPVGVCAVLIGLYGLGGWWTDEIPAIAALHILALALAPICVFSWLASVYTDQSRRPLRAGRLLSVPPTFLLLFIGGYAALAIVR